MATFFIKHTTKFTYSNNVIDGANLIRLHPINDDFQKVESHYITVTNNAFIETFLDFYNNRVGTFMITEPHKELSIVSEIEVITVEKIFPEDSTDVKTQWETLKNFKQDVTLIDFLRFQKFSGIKEVSSILKGKDTTTKTPYKVVLELCEYVYSNFKYETGITNVDSTLDDVWKLKAGVCQDFTNMLLQTVRMMGIPARYVSGYICSTDTATRGQGATHAWIEAFIPFYGWLGIDPTNNAIANENHVRLAVGRSYNDCSPVKGVFKGKVEDTLLVKVEVSKKKNKSIEFLPSQPVTTEPNNSYKRNLERMQQQQQQQ